mgnify:CR=1 FL=1
MFGQRRALMEEQREEDIPEDVVYEPGLVVCKVGGRCSALSLSPDRTSVAVGGRDVFKIFTVTGDNFLETKSLRSKRTEGLKFSVNDIKWHPSSTYIATAAVNGAVIVWNIEKEGAQRRPAVFEAHERTVNRLGWSRHDPNLLLSASQDGTVKLMDIRGKKVVHTFDAKAESVRDVQFSPSTENMFASVHDSGALVTWNLGYPSEPKQRISAHVDLILSLDFHPELSNVIATGGRDRHIKVWDINSPLRPRHTVSTLAAVGGIQWRPKHRFHIASAASLMEFTIRAWDVREPFRSLALWAGHKDVATGFQWIDNGDELVSCSKDGTLMLHRVNRAIYPNQTLCSVALAWNVEGELAAITDTIGREPFYVASSAAAVTTSAAAVASIASTGFVASLFGSSQQQPLGGVSAVPAVSTAAPVKPKGEVSLLKPVIPGTMPQMSELESVKFFADNYQFMGASSVSYTHLTLPTNREV